MLVTVNTLGFFEIDYGNLLVRFWISTWSWFLSRFFIPLSHWSSDDFPDWQWNLCTNSLNSGEILLVEVSLFLIFGLVLHGMMRNPIRNWCIQKWLTFFREIEFTIYQKRHIYHFRQRQSLHNLSNSFLSLAKIHPDFRCFRQYQAKILCNYSNDYRYLENHFTYNIQKNNT